MNSLHSEHGQNHDQHCGETWTSRVEQPEVTPLYPANYPDDWWDDPTQYAWADIVDEHTPTPTDERWK